MSSTIYGGTTFNNMDVDDMVDDNRDYVYRYPGNSKFFARLSGTRESCKDPQKPALVLFCEEEPFIPLYAMELKGTFADYMDKFGCLRGDRMGKPVKDFWKLVDGLSQESLKESFP